MESMEEDGSDLGELDQFSVIVVGGLYLYQLMVNLLHGLRI